jgi:hypothetical protein
VDDDLIAQADRILGLTRQRASRRKRRKPRPRPQAQPAQPTINVTVHVGDTRRPRAHGSTAPGRPGDLIENNRSRIRRIGPSPG